MTRRLTRTVGALALVAALLLSSIATPAAAATITVDTDGTADYNSIQAAVDAAADGDVVNVTPGTYYETVDVDTSNVTIRNANPDEGKVNIVAVRSNGGDGTLAVNSSDATNTTLDTGVETVNKSVLEVGDSGADYLNIQTAVDNADPGTVIKIQPDTYETSVNVSEDWIVFASTTGDNVTVDASDTSVGLAFYGDGADWSVGDGIEQIDAALAGGGGSGGTLGGMDTTTVLVVAVVVGGFFLVGRE
jgi:pectinesterase